MFSAVLKITNVNNMKLTAREFHDAALASINISNNHFAYNIYYL